MVVSAMRVWSKEGAHVLQKPRGEYAPYRIRNHTGCTVYFWSDSPGTVEAQDAPLVKLSDDEVIDWRFDDWKTTREVILLKPNYELTHTLPSMCHLLSNIPLVYALMKNHGRSYVTYL